MKNLVIMAGGKSSRMGRDKVFLRINEETFIERLYINGCHAFDGVFVSIDTVEHADQIMKLPALRNLDNSHVIIDRYSMHGPIGGLVSVFENTDLESFAVLPTDVPNADMRVLQTLLDVCKDKPCIFKRNNDDLEPLIGAYPKECLTIFKNRLLDNRNSLYRALDDLGYYGYYEKDLACFNPELASVNFEIVFRNINLPEDYEKINKTK